MIKQFFIKKMLQAQMKNLPKDQQAQMMAIVEKDPELLMRIAKEVQAKMKEGKTQMAASMEVMQAHRAELQNLMR